MKHMGAIDSDAVVGRYLDRLDQLPKVYAVRINSRVPWWRRLLKRLKIMA